MAKILVAGLINIETTVKVGDFPLVYTPVNYPFFGVNTTVAGVGYNIAKALTTLGHNVVFMSLIGTDSHGDLVINHLQALGIDTSTILQTLDTTAQSVILYDDNGRRMIYTDLKDIQDHTYPLDTFKARATDCDLAVLCNINFTRNLLTEAKALGLTIATDVHTIAELHDAYNGDYLAFADILFMSHEMLPISPSAWVDTLRDTYSPQIIGIGMGADGAFLSQSSHQTPNHVQTHTTRPVVNTIGGGDALFSAFIHGYLQTGDALIAMQKATLFASYKISTKGAAEGFITAPELDTLYAQHYS